MAGAGSATENIAVYARIRSSSPAEASSDVQVVGGAPNKIRVQHLEFNLDHAFAKDANQSDVYIVVGAPLVQRVVDGYNACIIAYGQTGSGKTFTMIGPEGAEHSSGGKTPNLGLLPRACLQLFKMLPKGYTVTTSYIEMYNDSVSDLLMTDYTNDKYWPLRETAPGHVEPDGITRQLVKNTEDVMSAVALGDSRRVVAAMAMNPRSSRGHGIISIEAYTAEGMPHGRLTLVDLAGMESSKKSVAVDPNSASAVKARQEEAKRINMSLLALSSVVSALAAKGSMRVPFRDSKLTRLLQSSLAGNCKAAFVVTLRGEEKNVEEAINTLRFAQRAKAVSVTIVTNVDARKPAGGTVNRQLEEELASAKGAIAEYQKKLADAESVKVALMAEVQTLLHEMQQLQRDGEEAKRQLRAATAYATSGEAAAAPIQQLERRNAQLEEENRLLRQRDIMHRLVELDQQEQGGGGGGGGAGGGGGPGVNKAALEPSDDLDSWEAEHPECLVYKGFGDDLFTVDEAASWQKRLEAGMSPNASNFLGQTVLHRACEDNYASVIGLLIDAHANINQTDGENLTPAHVCCIHDHAACLKLLLNANADTSKADGRSFTPLFTACQHGAARCLRVLLAHTQVDLNASVNGKTPLQIADKAEAGQRTQCRELLNAFSRTDDPCASARILLAPEQAVLPFCTASSDPKAFEDALERAKRLGAADAEIKSLKMKFERDHAAAQLALSEVCPECPFEFIDAKWLLDNIDSCPALMRDSKRMFLPLQEVRKQCPQMLVKRVIKFDEACRGAYRNDYLSVSHRWDDPVHPDPTGIQLRELCCYLKSKPNIRYVFYDFVCLAQGSRTLHEQACFTSLLPNINMLYLGCSVLILLDRSYTGRFWTQFEAWIAFQEVTANGLEGVRKGQRRDHIQTIHGCPLGTCAVLETEWLDCTAEKAYEKLASPDIYITNKSDKEVLLPKILMLDKQVRPYAVAKMRLESTSAVCTLL